MTCWAWAAAACKGTSHEKTGIRLQDAFVCSSTKGKESDFFFGVISDGAGSADYGGQGASIACNTLSRKIREFPLDLSGLPDDETINIWIDNIRDRIFQAADRRGLRSRDFAATLICVISNGQESVVVHIGDGCAVFKDEITDEWIAPTWPEQGEFASTTYFVTDEFDLHLRISRYLSPISALVLFSDGLERLALDFLEIKPYKGFLDGMTKPLAQSSQYGKDHDLSAALKNYLNSETINSRTDDDKSLIIAIKK